VYETMGPQVPVRPTDRTRWVLDTSEWETKFGKHVFVAFNIFFAIVGTFTLIVGRHRRGEHHVTSWSGNGPARSACDAPWGHARRHHAPILRRGVDDRGDGAALGLLLSLGLVTAWRIAESKSSSAFRPFPRRFSSPR